jgi:hypothetical protein
MADRRPLRRPSPPIVAAARSSGRPSAVVVARYSYRFFPVSLASDYFPVFFSHGIPIFLQPPEGTTGHQRTIWCRSAPLHFFSSFFPSLFFISRHWFPYGTATYCLVEISRGCFGLSCDYFNPMYSCFIAVLIRKLDQWGCKSMWWGLMIAEHRHCVHRSRWTGLAGFVKESWQEEGCDMFFYLHLCSTGVSLCFIFNLFILWDGF